MKIIKIITWLSFILFLVGCSPKHYIQVDKNTEFTELPKQYQGELVFADSSDNGLNKTGGQKPNGKKIINQPKDRHSADLEKGPGNVPELTTETISFLEKAVSLHMEGKGHIGAVVAAWPDNNIPPDHFARKVKNYLKIKGVNVPLISNPEADPDLSPALLRMK